MTSIAVIGAQGYIGSASCKALVERGKIDKVLALDLTKTGLMGVEERIVDIYNNDLLVETLKEVDLAINVVAPYFRHGTIVADAAFKAGIHYTDACADIEITKALLSQNEKWKEAGLTLITGLGASPGITNLLVAKLASKFDTVLEAHIAWVTGMGDVETIDISEGIGTLIDFINEEFGEIPTYKDGNIITVTGFKDGAEEIILNKTPCLVYHSGHSEPITLPLYFPDLRSASCKGNIVPFGLSEVFREALEKRLDLEKIIIESAKVEAPYEYMKLELGKHIDLSKIDYETANFGGGIQVKVKGLRKGKEKIKIKKLTVKGFNPEYFDMAMDTSIPIAVLSEEIALGKIRKRGAYAPEALGPDLAKKMYRKIIFGFISHYLKERKRVKSKKKI